MKSEPSGTQCQLEDERLWLGKLGVSWLIHRRSSEETGSLKTETETDGGPAYLTPSWLRFADP